MEQMHVVQHQVVRNVHHESIVQHDQVVVVVVLHDNNQIQHNVDVKILTLELVTFLSHIDVEMEIH